MSAVRFPDWEARLRDYFRAVADLPHVYGAHDCGLFAAGAVLAMTGHDFGSPFRGRYRTATGAARAMRRWGGGDLPATLTGALGAPVVLALGHRGDLCRFGEAVGVLMADHGVFVGRGETDDPLFGLGLQRVPRFRLDPAACWAVPFA